MSEPNDNSLPPGARKLPLKEGAHEVTSIVAYLIGVPKRIFENDFEPLELDIFTSLEKNKNARIIRHLCILRTSIERSYKYITEQGTKIAAGTFYSNMYYYPYQMYINWKPRDAGNILYNDMKFVTLLYELHNDYFTDTSKISDAPSYVKSNIYDFIDDSSKLVMVVDCENSDPYKLCAVFKNLSTFYTYKISKIKYFKSASC